MQHIVIHQNKAASQTTSGQVAGKVAAQFAAKFAKVPGMELYEFVRGRLPVLIDVPHAGTHVPDEIARRLTEPARLLPDTDWHVEKLYRFAAELGCGLFFATHSRYVVDLNRDPQGRSLYPGADNTELCPLQTFASQPIYLPGQEPDAAEQAERLQRYFVPYHERLAAELEALRQRFGYVVLLDGHSIRSQVPRFFAGRLPDLNLGTADGRSAAPELCRAAWATLDKERSPAFSRVHNGRFKGGYVTRHYGQPTQGLHALQLEMAQDCYLDEAELPPRFDAARAAALGAVLRELVGELIAWRPRQ
jgi:N-formylglutamate amidohydrolase